MISPHSVIGILVLLVAAPTLAGDWLQFRGNDARSYSAQTTLPADGKIADCVAWKKRVPGRAVSGPIVIDGRVIVTGSDGPHDDHLHVACYDADSGETIWQRRFWATGRTQHHPTSAVAAPTPASDGHLIFAFFSSNDLVCLDRDGNLQWLRGLTLDYPEAYNDTGMASSPCVIGDVVVVQVECQGDSFAAGLNKHTGMNLWRIDRQRGANWASPVKCSSPAGEIVLLQSPDRLSAHDPKTGQMLWSFESGCSSIPSVASDGDLIYLPSGGITALRPPRDPEQKQPEVVWKQNRLGPDSASPVVAQEGVFVINGGGVLVGGSTKNGDVTSQLRLSGTFWATPVVANDHLYAINQDGVLHVVRLATNDRRAEIVDRFELGEPVLGSPAIGTDALFIRSDAHLWKLAKK